MNMKAFDRSSKAGGGACLKPGRWFGWASVATSVVVGPMALAGPTEFVPGPDLVHARMNASFARHADDRVFVFGGHGPGFVSLGTAEVWRPDAGAFSALNMKFTHDGPAIARLLDGRILLAGGSSNLGVPAYAWAEIFNPADESFVVTGSMVRFRAGAGAATLTSGKVLIAGAWWVHNNAHTHGELFDPATGQFTATGALQTPRSAPWVVPMQDGGALVMGGMPPTGGSIDGRVERYNPVDGTYSVVQAVLFEGEPGWYTQGGNLPVDDLRLADGRFVNVATRTVAGVVETILITVDPVSGAIAKLPMQPSLPNGSAVNFYSPPVVSADGTEVFLLGNRTGTSPTEYLVARVRVATGRVIIPEVEGGFAGYYPSYAAMASLSEGRLLIAGGTTGNNFQAVAGTRLVIAGEDEPEIPALTVGLLNDVPGQPLLRVSWPQGGKEVVLEETGQLGAAWETVTAVRVVEDGWIRVTLPIVSDAPHRFLRVRGE